MNIRRRLKIAALGLLLALPWIGAQAQTTVIGANNRLPQDCSGTVASGGTAQGIFASAKTDLHGFVIMNIDTSEGMWMSFTGTAAASTAGSYFLQQASSTAQGGSYTAQVGAGFNINPSVIAATTAHKYSCTWW